MDSDFNIELLPEARFMRIEAMGFWSVDSLPGFLAEVERAERGLAMGNKTYFILSDLSGLRVQSPDVVDQIQRHLKESSASGAFSAFVISSALTQLQFKRISEGGNRRFFTTVSDAMEWLREMGLQV